ncbi:dihydropteroate synthase [Paenibacillus sp. HJGM_3]|uniref:dihydropteroate synthase n=1 Tax=Paenibacillus sp. HJGM_3 TaxID=3379816 RepID=UPI00385F23B7
MRGADSTGVVPCRNLSLDLRSRTHIMGILNVTPDSFSDGGRYTSTRTAVERAMEMVREGADLIDIGGESTRPGAERVTLEEELARVVPVVKALVAEGLPVPISVDTYKAEVARQAMEAGAHIVNDIWGFQGDPGLQQVALDFGCPVILMHNRRETAYADFIPDVLDDLRRSVDIALQAGVRPDHIILDPGLGFAKTMEHNLHLFSNLHRIAELGYPVLLGASRKSFIQKTLGRSAQEVLEGTAATTALGIAQGCSIVRVHDVAEMKRVALMTDAIVRGGKSYG